MIVDKLRAGSFKGAPFLVVRATTTGGRKQVKHQFPNADVQSIEDLGLSPTIFSLSVETTSDFVGGELDDQSYFDNRNRLKAALDEGGSGLLSHPFFSSDLEVVARPYTLTETTTELGIARFELVFDIDNAKDVPQVEAASLSEINAKTNAVTEQFKKDLEINLFKLPEAPSPFNLNNVIDIASDYFTAVVEAVEKVTVVTDKINEFSSDISSFQADIVQLVQAPSDLADSIITSVQSIRGLYATAKSAFNVYIDLFGFGDNLEVVLATTSFRDEQKTNQSLLTDSVQGVYLAQAYQAAAVTEYETVEEVDEVKEILETQFIKLVNAGLPVDKSTPENITLPVEAGLSGDLITSISTLRTISNQFLDAKRLTARNILDVTTNTTPVRVLAFRFYGEDNTDTTSSLIELNDVADVSFLSGDVKVLTV